MVCVGDWNEVMQVLLWCLRDEISVRRRFRYAGSSAKTSKGVQDRN